MPDGQPAARANAGLHDQVLKRAVVALPDRQATVVDVGCGTGALLLRLRELGYRNLVGVDIAPPIEISGIAWQTADLDAPALSLADRSVGLALAVEVIEHIENPGAFLAELSRILSPTGCAIVTTPNLHSVEARLRLLLTGQLKQFDGIGDPTHIYPVFGTPFERLLARHGLVILKRWGFPENGRSLTSRPGLRFLSGLARALGVRGMPDGDQVCYVLSRSPAHAGHSTRDKRAAQTAHYQS